ncbi:MAG: hypothetical protein AUJ92_12605 [Armatimonadetes bacterium CG2_30_59_28]|nr:SLC45 family MFS transporter [Armatimonadota bacterium]OIO93342.1 MAG: hypothetical protein AUJ92_12605 [Armatimonadetes bacterium CG2_30_59_28]PIU66303.1 MAG: hypothetical protein COS85_05490 [Armatimonadetes bacterium CG07_land_8_20_14_0_80_59_28]PIY48685.1 MAG: hypothetical protein COZ05_02495 [Armatimonadetes bacterium CG_4_10_14_3_um_filter_59_10]PJB72706.1 MAG: hypothetical protein CO095_06580 [Armatimonadetes bacterium CG_4_9_14_3_um_filter_58_7]
MRKPSFTFLLGLSFYWFTLTFIFGAVITILIPSLVATWFEPEVAGKWLGIVMGIGGIAAAVSQLLVGALSDHSTHRWGRRRPFILMGSALSVLVFIAMGAGLTGYWHFVALFILAQIALNIAAAPYTALLPDLIPREHHGRAAGLMGVARILGEGIGILFAAHILRRNPLHGQEAASAAGVSGHHLLLLMLAFSILMIIATTIILIQCRETPLQRNDAEKTWRQAVVSILHTSLRNHPDFSWLLVSRAVINLGVYTVASFILYFMEYALKVPDPQKATSTTMTILLVSAAAGSYPAGVISDRRGRKVVLYISCAFTASAGMAFVFCNSFPLAMVCAAAMGLGFGAFLSTDWAFACNLLPQKDPARYLAIWNLGAALPHVFAVFIGGFIADTVHKFYPLGSGHRAIFLLSVIYFVLGALIIGKVRETVGEQVDAQAPS